MYNQEDKIIKALLYFTEKNKNQTIKYLINKEKLELRNLIFANYIKTLFNEKTKLNVIEFGSDIFFLQSAQYDNIVVKTIYSEQSLKNREVKEIIKNTKKLLTKRTRFKYEKILIVSFNGFSNTNIVIEDNNIELLELNNLFYLINETEINKKYKDNLSSKENAKDDYFEKRLNEFKIFFKDKDKDSSESRVLLEKNKKLYTWMCRQRYLYKKGELSEYKINKLREVDFIFDENEYAWDKIYESLKMFYDEFGVIPVPNKHEKYKKLAKWVQRQRKNIRENKIDIEKRDKLIELGIFEAGQKRKLDYKNKLYTNNINYSNLNIEKWRTKLEEYNEYYKNKDKYISVDKNANKSLYYWVSKQRLAYKKGTLSQYKMDILNKNGFIFDVNDYNWDEKYNELVKYYEKYGETTIPYNNEYKKLASWVRRQIENIRIGKIDNCKKDKLLKFRVIKDVIESDWDKNYEVLKQILKNDKQPIDSKKKDIVFKWLDTQKSRYTVGKLSDDKIKKLRDIGIDM